MLSLFLAASLSYDIKSKRPKSEFSPFGTPLAVFPFLELVIVLDATVVIESSVVLVLPSLNIVHSSSSLIHGFHQLTLLKTSSIQHKRGSPESPKDEERRLGCCDANVG